MHILEKMRLEADKKAENMGWTSIEDEQPKDWQKVIFGCFDRLNRGFVSFGYYRHECSPGWFEINDDHEQVRGVTHWMKIPKIWPKVL